MKWIGFICILLGCMGVGFCSVSEYKRQIVVLSQIAEMLRYLQENIKEQCMSLPEAFLHCSKRMRGEYQQFLQGVYEQLERFSGEDLALIWRGQAEKLKGKMKKEYFEMFYHCMDQTGFMSAKAQADALNLYEKELGAEIKKLSNQQDEKCKLYQSLGIISGIFLCVLLF